MNRQAVYIGFMTLQALRQFSIFGLPTLHVIVFPTASEPTPIRTNCDRPQPTVMSGLAIPQRQRVIPTIIMACQTTPRVATENLRFGGMKTDRCNPAVVSFDDSEFRSLITRHRPTMQQTFKPTCY